MIDALLGAWGQIFDPINLLLLAGGVALGLLLGALPGIGGITGLTILIPFIFDLPIAGTLALLIGLLAVNTTSDSIPAILFGIPGSVSAQATIMDGYPMAQKGEAARALGASLFSSALGGIFGAFVLLISIPILRPLVLQFRSPEFFMMMMLGISMVAVLSRGAITKGLGAAGIGLLLTSVGQDRISGVFRYVYDTAYLWDGIPIIAVALGMFAIPELIDLALTGTSVSKVPIAAAAGAKGKWQGVKDCFIHWFAVLRSSTVGVIVGAIPGLGGAVVDWLAYGFAKQTSRNSHLFGTGDVRGVIAVDAAANAKEGGALITTVAFGVPGSVAMALMIVAFNVHGLVPGPSMLTTQLEFTLTMVWSLVLANVIGAGVCFMFVGYFAKVAQIPGDRLFPVLMILIFLGGYQTQNEFLDLLTLLIFGLIGWCMKRAGWPRPPLILGFVLGAKLQDTLFLSVGRYGASWLLDPIPLALGIVCVASLAAGAFYGRKEARTRVAAVWTVRPTVPLRAILTAFFLAVAIFFVFEARNWPFQAWLFPTVIGIPTIAVIVMQIVADVFSKPAKREAGMLSDLMADDDLPMDVLKRRATELFGWLLGFIVLTHVAGFLIAMSAFCLGYLKFRAKETWLFAGLTTLVGIGILYFVFDQLLKVVWPKGLIFGG